MIASERVDKSNSRNEARASITHQVKTLKGEGLDNAMIAIRLGIYESTVRYILTGDASE